MAAVIMVNVCKIKTRVVIAAAEVRIVRGTDFFVFFVCDDDGYGCCITCQSVPAVLYALSSRAIYVWWLRR